MSKSSGGFSISTFLIIAFVVFNLLDDDEKEDEKEVNVKPQNEIISTETKEKLKQNSEKIIENAKQALDEAKQSFDEMKKHKKESSKNDTPQSRQEIKKTYIEKPEESKSPVTKIEKPIEPLNNEKKEDEVKFKQL